MGFTRFEEIGAWQAARQLTQQVFASMSAASVHGPRTVADQMQRAALSCMNNVAEGFGRKSDRDFARFLWIASGSAREVQSTLYAATDAGVVNEDQFGVLYAGAEEVASKAASLARYLQRNERR